MILSVFLLFYFNFNSMVLIEDIYKDIKNILMDETEEKRLYNKLKNAVIFSFYSDKSNTILNDLIRMNDNNGKVLPLLDSNEMYFMRTRVCMYDGRNKDNYNQRTNWEKYLDNKNIRPILRINNVSEIKTNINSQFFNFDINIIEKECSKEITVQDLYDSSVCIHDDEDLLLVVSNLELDEDIFLIVLKAIKAYTDMNEDPFKGFVNFMVLNFKDLKSKAKFNVIINNFYQNLLDRKKDYIYIKSPFIIAEFQEERNNLTDLNIPEFKIRSMFEKDKNCKNFHILKENLEVTHFKKENDHMVCKRPGIVVKYGKKIIDNKIRKECSIFSRSLNTSIKIICEFEDEDLNFNLNNSKVYQRFSKLTIIRNDDLIQEIKFKSFYSQGDENKNLEIFENIFQLKNDTEEIIPTKEIYEKLRDNIFIFLKPGFDLFYKGFYKKFDFLYGDFVLINKHCYSFFFQIQEGSVITKYKKVFDKILSFIPELSGKYEIYYFDYIEEENNNFKRDTFYPDIGFPEEFKNVLSFRKRKIEDLSINEKIENIDDILILFKNVEEIQNSIYIHLKVRNQVFDFFKKSYEKILKRNAEELTQESYHKSRLNITGSIERYKKNDMLKILNIHLNNVEKCQDVFSFKKLIFKNLKDMKETRSYLIKMTKNGDTGLVLHNEVYLGVLVSFIFKINEDIKQKIHLYLKNVEVKFCFELGLYTSGYYYFKDYRYLESKIIKELVEKTNKYLFRNEIREHFIRIE